MVQACSLRCNSTAWWSYPRVPKDSCCSGCLLVVPCCAACSTVRQLQRKRRKDCPFCLQLPVLFCSHRYRLGGTQSRCAGPSQVVHVEPVTPVCVCVNCHQKTSHMTCGACCSKMWQVCTWAPHLILVSALSMEHRCLLQNPMLVPPHRHFRSWTGQQPCLYSWQAVWIGRALCRLSQRVSCYTATQRRHVAVEQAFGTSCKRPNDHILCRSPRQWTSERWKHQHKHLSTISLHVSLSCL